MIMISNLKIAPLLAQCCCRRRLLSTTSQMNFKFKLTDELTKEYEEEQKAQKKPEPELAKTTKENKLLMGKVSHDRYEKVIKVGVPKHRINDVLLMYVRENDDVQAHDESGECKPGDWVLLRKDENPIDKNVTHKVERVVYRYGNYIDPITKRRSLGLYYDDDMIRLEKIKVEL